MIVFQNPGLIEIPAITTSGVSAKVVDNPIGVFGTGLKYALAIILRGGGRITIWRGLKRYDFATRERTIRGEKFNIITMNGKDLGFTDQLGLNWKPWMAYRELWSNNRDEGGVIRAVAGGFVTAIEDAEPKARFTTVCVSGKEIEAAHEDRYTIILQTSPLFAVPGVEIHAGESKHLFYKGIRIMELPKPSMYTYNLTGTHALTEDRTLLYPFMAPVTILKGLVQAVQESFLDRVLSDKACHGHFEESLPYQSVKDQVPSSQFMLAAERRRGEKDLVLGALSLFNHHRDTMPGYVSPYIVELSGAEKQTIDVARGLVEGALDEGNAKSFREYAIIVKSSLSGRVIGTESKKTIEIGHNVLERGPLRVAQLLLEGFVYTKGGSPLQQLTNYLLKRAFIPRELLDTRNAHDRDDTPF